MSKALKDGLRDYKNTLETDIVSYSAYNYLMNKDVYKRQIQMHVKNVKPTNCVRERIGQHLSCLVIVL